METRLNSKTSLVNPKVLKGHIEHKKYEKIKRTIDDSTVVDISISPPKRLKQSNIQVEITDFPKDWIENEFSKLHGIIEALGQDVDGEKTTQIIFEKDNGKTIVVIFKSAEYAQKLYETLDNRVLDDCTVQVSAPHIQGNVVEVNKV